VLCAIVAVVFLPGRTPTSEGDEGKRELVSATD
jgi:hypothetical protein